MKTNNGWPVVGPSAVQRAYYAQDTDGALVLRGDVDTVFGWLVEQIHTLVEPVTMVNGWRSAQTNKEAGGAAGSNHMSGTAIDVNGHLHWYELKLPPSARGPAYRSGWSAAEIARIRDILARADGLISWGLDYPIGYRDAMHFDLTKGAGAKQVAALAEKIRNPGKDDDMPYSEEQLRKIIREEVAAAADDPSGKVFQIHARTQRYLDHKVSEIPGKVWAWVDKTKKHARTPYQRLVDLWKARPAATPGTEQQ